MEEKNLNQPAVQKSSNKLIICCLILAVLVAGVFVWYFFILDRTSECAECENQNIEFEEWQTYTSEDYNYQIKYPADWEYADDAEGNPAMFYDPTGLAQVLEGTELLQGTKIEIYVAENTEGMALEELVDEWDSETEVLSETETEIGGLPAIRRVSQGLDYMNGAYVLKNGNFYSIIQYLPQEKYRDIYTDYYDSILESFEFIN